MYPGTIINWYDQSEIVKSENNITTIDNSPLFISVGSFDKGPEDFMEVSGSTFNSIYGIPYFDKHGQNGIQTQRMINAGARVLVKRVVAEDSALANFVLTAKVSVPDDGSVKAEITWGVQSIENAQSFKDVLDAAKLIDDAIPVAIVCDNGRGASNKSFRLHPDYSTSKGIGKIFYTAIVYEGTGIIESAAVTLDPSVIYSDTAYGLEKNSLVQLKAQTYESGYEKLIEELAAAMSDVATEDEIRTWDLLNGYDYKGAKLTDLKVNLEGVNIDSEEGQKLVNGDNGAFGEKPIESEELSKVIAAVYRGEVDESIWDVDQYKIAAVFDANFPVEVKNAIASFVNFRKDCMFFRDLGLGKSEDLALDTFASIKEAHEKVTATEDSKSRYIADYSTCYNIRDPFTKKIIRVTMLYDLVECMAKHFASSPYSPTAGTSNGFVLKSAIKGSINYTPIVTPSVNQKEAMEDLKVNYAIFEDDNCVVQTLITSQEAKSQLSFINNVIAIQTVVRAVRTACPRNRYSLVTGTDMSNYAKAVNNVLAGFTGHFSVLKFEYTADELRASQKIFYANITFAFNDWVQTEVFDLFAINNF